MTANLPFSLQYTGALEATVLEGSCTCAGGGNVLGLYSYLFPVPKPNGEVYPIVDIKVFNKYLRIRKFCMVSTRLAIVFLQQEDFLASLDIKEAYLHAPFILHIDNFDILA